MLRVLLACLTLTIGLAAREAPAADDAALWRALAAGGHVALMRHALAPGVGDPRGFRLDDCATQRNLNDVGRAQARATGEAMRRNGISRAEVRTSAWCRCRETAELLGFGPAAVEPFLNSFFGDRTDEPAQTAALRDFIGKVVPGSPIQVLVTHQVNITALAGLSPRSGEIVVIAPGGSQGLQVLGRLGPFGPSD